jgi:hypothetical protein
MLAPFTTCHAVKACGQNLSADIVFTTTFFTFQPAMFPEVWLKLSDVKMVAWWAFQGGQGLGSAPHPGVAVTLWG